MNNFRVIRFNLLINAKQRNLAFSNHGISSQGFAKLTGRFGGSCNSLHSSTASHLQPPSDNNDESAPQERKYKNPVDWLPFQWLRRPRFNVLRESGDTIRENTIDLSLPKPDFELSDELKSASPELKHYFSLATASKGEIREVCKRHLLNRMQRHPNDYDSPEVKIALMTLRIRAHFVHHKEHSKWDSQVSRVLFPCLVQKRNKMLKDLRNADEERFHWVLDELALRFVPPPLALSKERYCKKWDLRKLTREHCEEEVARKKAAHCEELREQQGAFLEEKRHLLAWIKEEERAIDAL